MTTINGPVIFNDGAGSDSAASGVGPSTAVTGTGGSTDGTSTVDLSADSPDLSGVSAGDLFYLHDPTSGRQFSVIASVDDGADTVTCDDSFTNTESGLTWAIGGKRATFDDSASRRLFTTDGSGGWWLETETDQTLNGDISTSAHSILVRGAASADHPVITQANNDYHFQGNRSGGTIFLQNLKLQNSNGTKTNAIGVRANASNATYHIIDCILGDATNQLLKGFDHAQFTGNYLIQNCVVEECTDSGIDIINQSNMKVYDCVIRNNGAYGIVCVTNTSSKECHVHNCLFYGNATAGYYNRAAGGSEVCYCTFFDEVRGIYITHSANPHFIARSNIFKNCTTGSHHAGNNGLYINNNFHGNGTDIGTGSPRELNTTNLDPEFVSTGNADPYDDDFTPGDNMKGIGACIDKGLAAVGECDLGAIQIPPAGGGGGSSVLIPRGMSGGFPA